MTSAVWVGLSTCPQVEIGRASSGLSPAFSAKLLQAEQRIGMKRQLDEVVLPLNCRSRCPLLVTGRNDDLLFGVLQLQLKMELLKVEKRSADVTHTFYLGE